MSGVAARQPPPERLAYTPAELAQAAGLSRKAIYRAISTGELRAARVCSGARLLVPVEAARSWIDDNLVRIEREFPLVPPLPSFGSRHCLREAFQQLEQPPAGSKRR